MWLMLIVQSGIRDDEPTKELLGEGRQITAILSKSHKTAKENRKRRKNCKNQLANSPTHEFTNSRIHQIYLRPSMISSSASGPGLRRLRGSVASGSSTMFNCVRKSSRSGSM